MNEFYWPVRVYYEDTDAIGVVYYANYLKYMERARTEWLREIGFEQDRLINELSILFAVKKVIIDYQRPALFNDLLNVYSTLSESTRVSFTFEQTIFNAEEDELAKAEIKIACLDKNTLRPAPIPETILAELDHVN